MTISRREFLLQSTLATGVAAGLPRCSSSGPHAPPPTKARVVVIRNHALISGRNGLSSAPVRELLDEAARTLAGTSTAADAWAGWFKVDDRIGIKVNCLGYPTSPSVVEALGVAITAAGLAPDRLIVWDRTERELKDAGYELRSSGRGVRCFATDSLTPRGNAGYTDDILSNGAIGSLFSRVIADETTALVSASVLKDHNIVGMTGGLKNFFGAIHNPNKYHDNGGDPFVADVCSHPLIRDRLRLVVCDATRPQFNGGPSFRPNWQWPYGGLIIGTDPVAVDRVACEILERKRAAAGRPTLATEKRPVRYLASAEERGLGLADLSKIEVIGIGRSWTDVG